MFGDHKWIRILGIALAAVVILFTILLAGFCVKFHPVFSFNPKNVPPITANPINSSRVFAISYFRSDAGHDYSADSWDGETCRSMKHYFNWDQYTVNNVPVRSKPAGNETNINIYAPFDGTIIANEKEQVPIGTQVHIASAKNPSYYVRIFHMDLLPRLKVGSRVRSGQLIGTVGPMDGIDVSYEAMTFGGKTVYLSIFQYMTDEAFAPYAKLGFNRTDFILTKEQADAKKYQCNGEQFVRPKNFWSRYSDQLEGYVSLKENPYKYLYEYGQN